MTVRRIWQEPYAIYIVITSIVAIITFLIGHYTTPLAFRIDMNVKEITEMKKCLEERPTRVEIKPIINNMETDIKEIKEDMKDIHKLLLKIYTNPLLSLPNSS